MKKQKFPTVLNPGGGNHVFDDSSEIQLNDPDWHLIDVIPVDDESTLELSLEEENEAFSGVELIPFTEEDMLAFVSENIL